MSETKCGTFRQKKNSVVVEMNQARRNDDYATFAVKAASALHLREEPCSQLRLFKVSGGAVIQNEPIPMKEMRNRWTIGNYLKLLKKSPSSVKIGVAYVIHKTKSVDD